TFALAAVTRKHRPRTVMSKWSTLRPDVTLAPWQNLSVNSTCGMPFPEHPVRVIYGLIYAETCAWTRFHALQEVAGRRTSDCPATDLQSYGLARDCTRLLRNPSVNRLVAGSNPARGAKLNQLLSAASEDPKRVKKP